MIAADTRFHAFLYAHSGNELVAPALATHLAYTQRVMGGVMLGADERPGDVWAEHAQILEAICAGDAALAEDLARRHITEALGFMAARLSGGSRTTAAA